MKCIRPDEQLLNATLTEDTGSADVKVETVTSADFAYFAHLQTDDDGGVSWWGQRDASDYSLNLCRVDADCSVSRGIVPDCSTNCSFFGDNCGELFQSNEAQCDCGTGLERGNDVCLPADFWDEGVHNIPVRPCSRFRKEKQCNDAFGYLGRKCSWDEGTNKCM